MLRIPGGLISPLRGQQIGYRVCTTSPRVWWACDLKDIEVDDRYVGWKPTFRISPEWGIFRS
jgi:hypothetical protein